MFVAQYPAAAFERVLVEVAGGLGLTKLAQVGGQVVGRVQRVRVILAQNPAATFQRVLVQVPGGPKAS